jgi:hypothetical protein
VGDASVIVIHALHIACTVFIDTFLVGLAMILLYAWVGKEIFTKRYKPK